MIIREIINKLEEEKKVYQEENIKLKSEVKSLSTKVESLSAEVNSLRKQISDLEAANIKPVPHKVIVHHDHDYKEDEEVYEEPQIELFVSKPKRSRKKKVEPVEEPMNV